MQKLTSAWVPVSVIIAVVLWIPDGLVGTIANWFRRRRRGTLAQLREDQDRIARDRQQDWKPAGAAKPGEEAI